MSLVRAIHNLYFRILEYYFLKAITKMELRYMDGVFSC